MWAGHEFHAIGAFLSDIRPKPQLVIVDDDVEMVEALAGLLSIKGFAAKAFHGPKETLEYIRSNGVCDLVIADLRMGDQGTGLELYEAVQLVRKIPFLILTGDVSGFEEMFDHYKVKMLMKPVPSSTLVAEINAILKR